MKIAMVISALGKGGAERVLSVLANFFCRENEVCVIKFDADEPFYALDPKIELISLDLGVGDLGVFGNIKKRYDKILALHRLLKSRKFDVVISFLDNTNVLTLIANLGVGQKIIVSEHTNHRFLKSPIWRALKRIFYPRAAGLSVLSKFDLDHYTYVQNRVIMPNPMFEISHAKDARPPKENIILAAGRLNVYKGFDVLLKALALIDFNLLKEWKVVIAGDGEERKSLESLAAKLRLNVQFIGFVRDIESLYERAKIVVVTSKMEGFCNILMESIFFGTARISTDCIAGPSELISDGIDGFLCPVGDSASIAKKLEILMSDEKLRERLVQNASKREESFKIETIGQRWLDFIAATIHKEE